MKTDLLTEMEANTAEFFALLAAFDQERFNTVPAYGGWTAGQVASHLHKAESHVASALFGPVEKTDRAPQQFADGIRGIFLDFDKKMQAPARAIPDERTFTPSEFEAAFRQSRERLREALETLDMDELTSFQFPTVGFLTRGEILTFAITHAYRHTRQMRNIAQNVGVEV
ncbi:DinB family protein [Chitinophaga lutea]